VIYEYRRYKVMPGRMEDLQARFADRTMRYFDKYGINIHAFWVPVVGDSNELHYMVTWNSMAEREEKWPAFRADPQWRQEFIETEKDGVLVERYTNALWAPTAFSPLQ
jgi:hypothetical protein